MTASRVKPSASGESAQESNDRNLPVSWTADTEGDDGDHRQGAAGEGDPDVAPARSHWSNLSEPDASPEQSQARAPQKDRDQSALPAAQRDPDIKQADDQAGGGKDDPALAPREDEPASLGNDQSDRSDECEDEQRPSGEIEHGPSVVQDTPRTSVFTPTSTPTPTPATPDPAPSSPTPATPPSPATSPAPSSLEDPTLDPIARNLWRQLAGQSENSRRLVLRAIQTRQNGGASRHPERVQLAIYDMTKCMDEIGHPPSRREYDEWREKQDDPDQHLSATGIRNAFGNSWARAKEALNVTPRPDPLARRLLNINRPYTPEELLAGIRAYLEAVTVSYAAFDPYRLWAIEELKKPEHERSCERFALSRFPFEKCFGSWGKAVIAAGFPELARTPSTDKHLTNQPGVAYTDEQLRKALLDAHKRHLKQEAAAGRSDDKRPARHMSRQAFDDWRCQRIDEAAEKGKLLNLPSSATIIWRRGSWPRALHWAGLMSADRMRVAHRHKSRPMTDDEVLDFLVKALKQLRPLPADEATQAVTLTTYRRWRQDQLLENDDPWGRPASDSTMVKRFGDWDRALALAAARRHDPEATLAQLAARVDGEGDGDNG